MSDPTKGPWDHVPGWKAPTSGLDPKVVERNKTLREVEEFTKKLPPPATKVELAVLQSQIDNLHTVVLHVDDVVKKLAARHNIHYCKAPENSSETKTEGEDNGQTD